MTNEQRVKVPRRTLKQEQMREFDELCEIEPRLRALYERAKGIKDDKRRPSFCANDVWFGRAGE